MPRPNRTTVGLAGLLLAALYAGLSQNNAAAYLFAFLLSSLAAISTVHAWANLRGLEISGGGVVGPVFAGERLLIPIRLSAGARERFSLTLRVLDEADSGRITLSPLPRDTSIAVEVPQIARRRGRFETIRISVESGFPLGFFTARREFALHETYHVYPRPEGALPLPLDDESAQEIATPTRAGGEDFAGVRDWRQGESMRHVDWKAVARGQRPMVKQWTGGTRARYCLEATALSHLEPEARWSQLAQWVVEAERHGAAYELRLPAGAVTLGHGEHQLHAALRSLAEA